MTKTRVLNDKPTQDGYREEFNREKLAATLNQLSFNLDMQHVNVDEIMDRTVSGLPDLITVKELLSLVAENIAMRVIYHGDHAIFAGRVEAFSIRRNLENRFSDNVRKIANMKAEHGRQYAKFSDRFYEVVKKNASLLDSIIKEERDYDLSYFAIKTLQKSYFIKIGDEVYESPQYMFLRIAIGIHFEDIDSVIETYELMSQRYFIHASPTLFNAGMELGFLSSCFLVAMESDSIDGIFKTLHKTALLSKAAGGVGLHVHNIRGAGSLISSLNGYSSGLVPMLRIFNNAARYVDQGGNKRPGVFSIYLEPWHVDIFDVLDLKKNNGKEEMRARDLFYGLWIPDLFMKRVRDDHDWTLFSPDTAPGLSDCYGNKFESLYQKYESTENLGKKIKARKLWQAILESQVETGGPFMLFKDPCNLKSNQKNLGVIKSSNLCCEIVEFSSEKETAVCNLGSLALPRFIKSDPENPDFLIFDFKLLHHYTKILTKNLDRVIDLTLYPIESTKYSNLKNRPMAIGVQGLADLFLELRIPFDSHEARKLNIQIFETIYHAAVECSIELAVKYGPYDSFADSPASQGKLQFDLWDHKPSDLYSDWNEMKDRIKKYGLRNSLLVAPMPTASTSQILGYNECFEPYTSNIYTRRVLSGEFQVVNNFLLKDLIDLGLWSPALKDKILQNNGSIQDIPSIPQDLKELYRTVWEIPQRAVIDMAADRGKFIDQLQSMNIYLKEPSFSKLTSSHFYAWEKGLKTGMYYLRTRAAARPIQFTISQTNDSEKPRRIGMNSLKRRRYHESNPGASNYSEDQLRETKRSTSSLESARQDAESENVTYDIYSDKKLSCNIEDPEACFSCSG